MEKYDVLLINPPTDLINPFPEEHLGLSYISACLNKKKISNKVLDFRNNKITISKAIKDIMNISFKIAGISVPFQEEAREVFSFIKTLKSNNPDIHINIGGIYPSFNYKEILLMFPSIDSISIGEGEETFIELTRHIIKGTDWHNVDGIAYAENINIKKNKIRPLINDLDDLPFPERYALKQQMNDKKIASMITSRGCYARCSFCSVVPFYSKFGKKLRFRSSESVIQEIELLYNRFGIRNIFFNDANFILGKGIGYKRTSEICNAILKRNLDLHFVIQCRSNDIDKELFSLLKRAGLRGVFLGIESGSQTMLDRYKKDITVEQNLEAIKILEKLNLSVVVGFIPFDYRVTFNELYENMIFMDKIKKIMSKDKLRYTYLTKILPYAGTEVETEMKNDGIYKGSSLKFSYKIKDPRINFIYNAAKMLSNTIAAIKKKMGIRVEKNFYDWTIRE